MPESQRTSKPEGQRTSLVIRSYEPRDQEAVWRLHVEGLEATRSAVKVGSQFDEDLRDVEAVYLKDGSHFWVVQDGEEVVAMVGALRRDGETVELRRMRVASARRRRGLGQRLLELVEEFARRQGYRRVVLETTDRQEAARRLYERNGYVLVEAMPIAPLTLFFYRKELR